MEKKKTRFLDKGGKKVQARQNHLQPGDVELQSTLCFYQVPSEMASILITFNHVPFIMIQFCY